MIEARAFAKLTVSLRVAARDETGLHPVDGRFQSIGWFDALTLETSETDVIESPGGGPVIDGSDNLAWRAVEAVRAIAVAQPPLHLTLGKSLPVAAGLGGGSADGATALAAAASLLGVDRSEIDDLAPQLGSDVPFCLVGGSAWVSGTGDRVRVLPASSGYAFGLVVPPVDVATPAVYRRWDQLDGPPGRPLSPGALPPGLRDEGVVNDLYDAAVAVAPEIDEWRIELEHAWGRPVALAGSGPTLFAFFVDRDEATAATESSPAGARGAFAGLPVDHGWLMRTAGSDGVVDSKGRAQPIEVW